MAFARLWHAVAAVPWAASLPRLGRSPMVLELSVGVAILVLLAVVGVLVEFFESRDHGSAE